MTWHCFLSSLCVNVDVFITVFEHFGPRGPPEPPKNSLGDPWGSGIIAKDVLGCKSWGPKTVKIDYNFASN